MSTETAWRTGYRWVLIGLLICCTALFSNELKAQPCTVAANASYTSITCGECVTLSHVGITAGNVSFSEDFNSGSPTGWSFTQQATYSNPCSPNGVDGTTHIWMGDQSGVPRALETLPLDFSSSIAPAGGTICFDMLYAEQGGTSPCEGPDEPDEGVYLQYSIDGGASWITIQYYDPNGGSDPQFINWNNWCEPIPVGALVNGVQFRWFQDNDSGAEYDHWGIDNVEILVNDPNVQYVWQHDGYTTSLPGEDPTPVCPMTTTSYTVVMTTSTATCQAAVQIDVVNPDVQVSAGPDQIVCAGDCINLAGSADVINDPGGITTFSNIQTENFDASVFGGASVNINVQDLNMSTVNPSSLQQVCISNLTFTGFGIPLPGVETLSLTLVCPDGTQVELVPIGGAPAGVGGFFDPSSFYQNACFVTSGGSDLGSVAPANASPITGTFNSSQPLTGMDGCTANGVWSIEVSTNAFTGSGTFDGWSITFDDEIDQYVPSVLWSPTTGMSLGAETTLTPQICPTGPITYTLTTSDDAGCVTVSDDMSITIDPNCCDPQTPPITGTTPLCAGATGEVYAVVNTIGSTYTWTVPSGATITSGQGTNSVTVDFGANGGTISVVETISCGDGPAVTFDVTVNATPVLNITDPAAVCLPATVDITAPSITNGSTGNGILSYWNDAAATSALSSPNAVSASGTYYIQSSAGACTDIQPVTVTVNNCASCTMNSLDMAMTDCYTSGLGVLQYDVEGTLAFTDPPTTGQLIVTDCFQNVQTFNPPFTSPLVFSYTGLPQDGLDCSYSAVFTDDPNCTITVNFTAPPAITFFSSNCVVGAGTVDGTIEFDNPPSTGTLIISIDDGVNTMQTVLQPPFVSPATWQVTGLDPSAANYVITYYFSGFQSCAQTQAIICGCAAEGGTTTTTMAGDGQNSFILCDGDQVIINNNNDFTFPDDEGPIGGYSYQPAYTFLVYSCPPTPGVFPNDDPCLVGIIPSNGSMTDTNGTNSIFSFFPPGLFTNNQIYYVPITLYHYDPVNGDFIVNTNCWDLGSVSTVTYLPPVTSTVTPDCQTNSITVTLTGGYPEVYGGDFTGSNLQPSNASFVNTTATNGGDIVINGLQNGQSYSFDVTDGNGCPHTISGGPFIAVPVTDAGTDDSSCSLTYDLAPVPSYGTGTWTGGPIGSTFSPDANTSSAVVTVLSSGTYTFTWTEDNGSGCTATDDVQVAFSELSIPAVVTNISCGGADDGEVVVAPQGGIAPYAYSWTSGGNAAVESNLPSGNVTVTVTDDPGCSLDSTFTLTAPAAFSYTATPTDVSCANTCDGQIDIQPTGIGPFSYAWTPNVSTTGTATGLCAGDYSIEITGDGGCVQTASISVSGPLEVITQVDADTTLLCIGGSATLSATVNGGTPPYDTYMWTASPPDPTLISSMTDPTVSPVVTTTYTLVITDSNGCSSSPKTIVIEVLPPLILDFVRPLFGPDTAICPYDLATIDLTASGGDGNYDYFLLPDTVPLTLPIDTQPSITTSFSFMVTDGCTTPPAFASNTVTVYNLPDVNFEGDPQNGCDPLTVLFTDQSEPTPVSWTWDFGDAASGQNSSNEINPGHLFSRPDTYSIYLSVVSAEGCVNDTMMADYIEVFASPTADFELDPQTVNLLDAHIFFADLSSSNVSDWNWSFGDGGSAILQSPEHVYTDTGTFTVMLLVATINGCTDQTQQQLTVEPDVMFYIPSAFSPNNDGRNDFFRGYGEGIDWKTYTMSVYDRWGEMIYYTESIDEPWNGTFKGQAVELGVYVWKVNFYDVKGQDHSYLGRVTLFR